MNEDDIVECGKCGHVHTWGERVEKFDPEYSWTYSLCPECGDESYWNVEPE